MFTAPAKDCKPPESVSSNPLSSSSPSSSSVSSISVSWTPPPVSRATSTDTTASAASSLSIATSASSLPSTAGSVSTTAQTAAVVEPAIVLQEETGLRAPPPNKGNAYLFFASARTPPPGTLRTHSHAALPPARRLALLSCPPAVGEASGSECIERSKQVESIAAVNLDVLRAALMMRQDAQVDEQLRMLCGAVQRDEKMVLGGDNQLMTRLMTYDAACTRDKLLPLLLSHLSAASQVHLSSIPHPKPASASKSEPQRADTAAAHIALHLGYLFSYLTTGSASQCQHLIGVGIVPHLTHLLASYHVHHACTTECALTALGNLSADPSCRSVVLLSGVTDILKRLLIIRRRREHEFRSDCSCIECCTLPSRRLSMWVLSVLARSMVSSGPPQVYIVLSPLIQPLCAMTELEADADLLMHLLFFLYSVTAPSPGAYHFPLSSSQQSHHARLCALLPLSVLPLLVTALTHDDANLAYAALSTLANLSFASVALLTHLIESTRPPRTADRAMDAACQPIAH